MKSLHHGVRRPLAVLLLCLSGLVASASADNATLFEFRAEGVKKTASDRGKRKAVKAVHSVRVSPEALAGEILDLPLPSGVKKAFRKKELRHDEAGYAIWVGASLENPAETATILAKDGKVNASFLIEGRTYSLEPSGEPGEHLLLERDFKEMQECATR